MLGRRRTCCTTTPPTCLVTICVEGCFGNRLVGASVTISSGAFGVSGTTIVGGCVTLLIPAAGAYTVVASFPGYNTSSGPHTLTCGGTTTITLTVATGQSCDSCSGCNYPLKDTLVGNDGMGAFTLTNTGGTWTGCAIRTVPGVCCVDTGCNSLGTCDWTGPVFFSFSCVELSLGYNLTASFPVCYSPGSPALGSGLISGIDCSYVSSGGIFTFSQAGGAAPASSCEPFSWSNTLSLCGGGTCPAVFCSFAYFFNPCTLYGCTPTFSVTE